MVEFGCLVLYGYLVVFGYCVCEFCRFVCLVCVGVCVYQDQIGEVLDIVLCQVFNGVVEDFGQLVVGCDYFWCDGYGYQEFVDLVCCNC